MEVGVIFGNLPSDFEPDESARSSEVSNGRLESTRRQPREGGSPGFEGVHVKELLGVLRRHVRLILVITVLMIAPVAYMSLTDTTVYVAGALIRLADSRRTIAGEIGEETETNPIGRYTDEIRSQIQLLQSAAVFGDVVDREGLRLTSLSETFPIGILSDVSVKPDATVDSLQLQFMEANFVVRADSSQETAAYGTPLEFGGVTFTVDTVPLADSATLVVLPREMAVGMLMGGVSAQPRELTDLVDVTYTSTDPQRAVRVVNAIVEEFKGYSASVEQQQSRRRRRFLEAQLKTTDSLLSEAQSELAAFRSQHQVFRSEDRMAAQQKSIMDLDIRRAELDAERRMYRSLLATFERPGTGDRDAAVRTLVSTEGMADNPVVSQLYRRLVEYEARLDSLTAGPRGSTQADPDVQRVEGLIDETVGEIVAAARSHVASLDANIEGLDGLRARSAEEIQQLPPAQAEEERLTQRVESVSDVAERLRMQLQEARMSEAIEAGQVEIVNLAPMAVPSSGGTKKKLILAIMLGLMLGCGGAFAAEALNTSIRRYRQIPTALELTQLAVIPRTEFPSSHFRIGRFPPLLRKPGGTNGNGRRLINTGGRVTQPDIESALAAAQGHSAAAEAFRTLRTNLMFSPSFEAVRSLVITSASPEEGKTTVAANLAFVFAQQGIRILLIDADLRRPRLHKLFGMVPEPGLSALLEGRYSPAEAVRETSVPGLFLLPSGVPPANPAELLGGDRMRRLLLGFPDRIDLLIVDTPPILAASEASVLAAEADSALLVVRAGKTEQGAAQQGLEQLAAVRARLVGAVLNDPDGQVARYHDYHYAYDYYADRRATAKKT